MCRFGKICGFSYDGGWAEYVVVPAEAVALLPDGLSVDEAAPLLCAGITTFNSLRHSGARAGDVVGVQGVGGLGHLALQYASKMGFITVAIGRGQDKATLARNLGAVQYVDAAAHDAAQELQRLGGARVILATAPDSKAIASMVDGLSVNGTLLIVAAPGEPVLVNALSLIGKRTSVRGWPSGTAKDSEDTLRFSVAAGIRPMIERYPLARAQEAYQQMMTGKARFRAVLTMNS
jgi:D-arabinose 1-dehydrogenase-like Zn-dependent alcohol dehydrogenase